MTPLVAAAALGLVAACCSASPAFPQTEAGPGCRGDRGAVPREAESHGAAGPVAEVPAAAEPLDAPEPRAEREVEADPETGVRRLPLVDHSGAAMETFFRALSAVEGAKGAGTLARIVFFGDSHTASDALTGELRRRLQARFGDGGHGFIAAGRPWPSYRHEDVESGSVGAWDAYRMRNPRGRPPDGAERLLGLAGLAVETERPGAAVWVGTSSRGPVGGAASRFELFYLGQPRGGRFEVSLDGTVLGRLSSNAPEPTPAYYAVEVADGPHQLRVTSLGRGVLRLFGFVLERRGPGVVVDSLGINGARVMTLLAADRELLAEHLGRRDPDLVVLWYGTNEAGDDWYTLEQYEQWYLDALTVARRAAPGASCLVMAPPDMGRASLYEPAEGFATPATLRGIVRAQRDAAELHGCAYFDTFGAMGGRDSMARWAALDPPLVARDCVHLTRPGYALVSELLHAALIDAYEQRVDRQPAE